MFIIFILLPVVIRDTSCPGPPDGPPRQTMYTHFTDAENTGAPLVPYVRDTAVATDGGQDTAEYLEEVIWSHRLEG